MKKILLAFVLVTSVVAMTMTEVHARRMGGGRSFGRQAPNVTRSAPMQRQQPPAANQAQQAQKAAPAQQPGAAAPKPASRWGGILGGALLGLGLGALLSHMGIGGQMAGIISTLLMVAIIFFAIRFLVGMFRKKREAETPAYASGYQAPPAQGMSQNSLTPEIGSNLEPAAKTATGFQPEMPASTSMDNLSPAERVTWGIPEDFQVDAFLRSAKTYFIRMQAAWDKANIDDILEFTTPEMYAELKMQLNERGPSQNVTDVVTLDAELLGIETIGGESLASVKFSGTLREAADAPVEPFMEVWNLTRSISGKDGWVLAGIQQLS